MAVSIGFHFGIRVGLILLIMVIITAVHTITLITIRHILLVAMLVAHNTAVSIVADPAAVSTAGDLAAVVIVAEGVSEYGSHSWSDKR
jgi:hypothetical protein